VKDAKGCLVGLGIVLVVAFGPLIYTLIATNFWRNWP
jgi:hypothetical protein